MKSFGWIIAGIVAAALGAAIWAGIAYSTGFEIGWIAWGVGLLVGIAVAATAQDNAGTMTGIGAAAIALAGVLGGKYATVRMMVEDAANEGAWAEVSDELVISYVADDIAQEWVDAGQEIEWPTEYGLGEASEREEYPDDLWDAALERWEAGGPDWQADYREFVEQTSARNLAQIKSDISEMALKESIGIIDIVFFLLAVATAWQIGSGAASGGNE